MKTARDYLIGNTALLIGWVLAFGLAALSHIDEGLGFVGLILFALLVIPGIVFGCLGITRFFILYRKASREEKKTLWLLLGTSLILLLPIALRYIYVG